MERQDHDNSPPDWSAIRRRAKGLSPRAFEFVREGLGYTATSIHGPLTQSQQPLPMAVLRSRHITGQQLCEGLRQLAVKRYGMLAGVVLRRWGLRGTDDFGVVVYKLIDDGDLRPNADDRFEDFVDVFDFEEAFSTRAMTIV